MLEPFRGRATSVQACRSPATTIIRPRRSRRSIGAAADVAEALRAIARTDRAAPVVLIMGSLYLAGAVLQANGQPPD